MPVKYRKASSWCQRPFERKTLRAPSKQLSQDGAEAGQGERLKSRVLDSVTQDCPTTPLTSLKSGGEQAASVGGRRASRSLPTKTLQNKF